MRSKYCWLALYAVAISWSAQTEPARAVDEPGAAAAISLPAATPATEQAGILTQTIAPSAGTRLVWDLAPPDPHGIDWALAAIRLGPEGQARTKAEYQSIRDRYSSWLTAQGLQPGTAQYVEAFGKLTAQEAAGAVLIIQLDSSLDATGVKALESALAVESVPAPRTETLDFETRPGGWYGMTIRWAVLPAARFRGIKPDQASAVSDDEQQAKLQAQLAAVRTALNAWNARRQADLAALKLQAPQPAPVLAEMRVGTVLRGWEVRTNLPDGDAVELAKVLAQPGLVEPQIVRPANYKLDQPNGGQPGRFITISPDDIARMDSELLSFQLVDRERLHGFAAEEYPALFATGEQAQLTALADSMERALVDWNAHHSAAIRARLERQVTAGIVTGVTVYGADHSIDTVLSLGAALSVPGAPVYRYGSGFTMRNEAVGFSYYFPGPNRATARMVFTVPDHATGTSQADTTGGKEDTDMLTAAMRPYIRLQAALTGWIAEQPDLRLLPEGFSPRTAGSAQIWSGDATGQSSAHVDFQLTLELCLQDKTALDAAVASLTEQIKSIDPDVTATTVQYLQ